MFVKVHAAKQITSYIEAFLAIANAYRGLQNVRKSSTLVVLVSTTAIKPFASATWDLSYGTLPIPCFREIQAQWTIVA